MVKASRKINTTAANLNVRWRCITTHSPFGNTNVCGTAGPQPTHRLTSPVIFNSKLGSLPDSFLLLHDLGAHDWRRTRQWRPSSHAPKRQWSAPAEVKHRGGDTADDGRVAAGVPQLDALAERITTHKAVICVSDPSEEGSEPDSGKVVRPLREHNCSRTSKR